MAKPGNHFRSKTEREKALVEVARLDRLGYNQFDIAAKIGVTQPCISQYLTQIRGRYKESQLANRHELVMEKVELLRELRKELTEAWERSKEDLKRRVKKRTAPLRIDLGKGDTKNGKGGKGKAVLDQKTKDMLVSEIVDTIEGRLPASQYIALILDTIKQERELLGLDAPTTKNVNLRADVASGFDWDRLYTKPSEAEYKDVVEGEVAKLTQQLPTPVVQAPQPQVVDEVPPALQEGDEHGLR